MEMTEVLVVTYLHTAGPSETHHISTWQRPGGHLEQAAKWACEAQGMQCLAHREGMDMYEEIEVWPVRSQRQETAATACREAHKGSLVNVH